MGTRAVRWVAIGAMVAGAGPAACGRSSGSRQVAEGGGVDVVDDGGRMVRLERPARRVISLVPSVTETIVALGGADRLVARTRYDREPGLAELPDLGGGLDPSLERLIELDPDLVVTWSAQGGGRMEAALRARGIAVYGATVQDTADVLSTIVRVGTLLGRGSAASSLVGALRDSLAAVAGSSIPGREPSVFWLVDGDPPRTAGPRSFIGQLVRVAGGRSAFPELTEDWPAVSLEAVVARRPDVVVVPLTDGSPTADELRRRAGWRDLPAVRAGRVVELPADLVSRPGPGIARAARVLHEALARALRRAPLEGPG